MPRYRTAYPPEFRRQMVDLVRSGRMPEMAQPDIDRVAQEVVGRPGQIGDLDDKLRLDPVHARKNERRAEARLAR